MAVSRDVVIVGAGPYGLSCSAHLTDRHVDHAIFGSPMNLWREHMPPGMHLKSDGVASSLYDPRAVLPLRRYCAEHGLPYADFDLPVPVEMFIRYGMTFQERLVPHLDRRSVARIGRQGTRFSLRLDDETEIIADRVVVATGIDHYRHIPAELGHLPPGLLTHSAEYGDVGRWAGKKIIVIGRGASAIDVATLAHEAGADVNLVARSPKIAFHPPPPPRRGPRTRLKYPHSGIGPGWRNVFYCKLPGIFRLMSLESREAQVRTWLGPAPGWFMRQRAEGKFPAQLGWTITGAESRQDRVVLQACDRNGRAVDLSADHIIAATGFKTDIARLAFLDESLMRAVATHHGAPLLSKNFESSVENLYFVGPPAALSFGPLMRFAVGAAYTSARLGRHLSARAKRPAYVEDDLLDASVSAAQ